MLSRECYLLSFFIFFFSLVRIRWPQAVDDFLRDMSLPPYRSGGNWLNWVFQVIDAKEIANLSEERRANREASKVRL